MIAVSDASPIIWLSQVTQFGLLRDLFTTVVISPEVHAETVDHAFGRPSQANVQAALKAGWMKVIAPNDIVKVGVLRAHLHAGEAETLVLAQEQGQVVLVDDLQARNLANAMGLRVLGTAGVLLLAQRRGLQVDVKRTLDEMRGLGFWLSDSVYARIMRQL